MAEDYSVIENLLEQENSLYRILGYHIGPVYTKFLIKNKVLIQTKGGCPSIKLVKMEELPFYGFEINNKKERKMKEVEIGVDRKYTNNKYTLEWMWGNDYLEDRDLSAVIILKDGVCVFDLGIFSLENLKPYNKMLEEYGFKLLEPKKITITSDTGEKITISKDKAEELGFDIS